MQLSAIMGIHPHPASVLAAVIAACSGICHGAFVLDQIGGSGSYNLNVGSGPTPSQIFTDFPDYSCAVLENFTVTSSELEITNVSALFRAQGGFIGFQSVSGYSLNFFSNPALASASLTGDVASLLLVAGGGASVTQVPGGGGGQEYGLISLDVNVVLPAAGQYWVGISPVSALSVSGQFLLLNSGASGVVTPGGTDARLANPGDGFGLGTLSVVNLDHAYSVTVVPEPTAAFFAILGSGCLLRRKRR